MTGAPEFFFRIGKTILLNTGFNPILFLNNCVDEERGPQVKLRSQNHA
jgi:hypothetical protein